MGVVCPAQGMQTFQVPYHRGYVGAGVAAINVGIQVFDVHNKKVGHGCQFFQALWREVERSLYVQFPAGAAQVAETGYKGAVHSRFATAKGHSPAGGPEIEIVNLYPVVEFLRREVHTVLSAGFVAQGIEAIAALQRTSAEGGQCGHSRPVSSDAQP